MSLESKLQKFVDFLKTQGFSVSDEILIKRALTHSSYIHNQSISYVECNERLEFYGDAVLKLIASNFLYNKFENETEGFLSKIRSTLVSDKCIEKIGKEIGLNKVIIYKKNLTPSMIACAFEALLGALYLNGQFDNLTKFLTPFFEKIVPEIQKDNLIYNAKNILQEHTQANNQLLPEYKITKETGSDHDKTFESSVFYDGKFLAKGVGKTKKEAEQKAAYRACLELGIIE